MGICSWNFRICDGPVIATLQPNFLQKRAFITYGDAVYEVANDGVMADHWILVLNGKRIAQTGPNFEIFDDDIRFTLRRADMLSRSFEIALPSGRVGTIERAHPFTRRSFIECNSIIPVPLQLFCFCLVVFVWEATKIEIETGD